MIKKKLSRKTTSLSSDLQNSPEEKRQSATNAVLSKFEKHPDTSVYSLKFEHRKLKNKH